MHTSLSNTTLLGVFAEQDPLGASFSGLSPDGAAQAAGVQKGDIITAIDQHTVGSPANLTEVIAMYAPGAA